MSNAKVADEEAEGSGEEGRYGLRGRKKRMKAERADPSSNKNQSVVNQQSSTNLQEKVDSLCAPKIWLQFNKRNEKNGIVCAYCTQPETMENPCTFYCHSYCQRSFHEKCKDKLFPKKESESGEELESPLNAAVTTRQQTKVPDGYWQCEDCSENTAQCFCCKNKGLILVFPKKGKPKAAGQGGSANQLESPSVMGEGNGGNDNDIEDEDLIEQQQKL